MPTMTSTLDAQARADIDSRPWYVVAYRCPFSLNLGHIY